MQGRHSHQTNRSRGQREDAVEAVMPNLAWRYSGGTAANQAIAPGLARLLRVVWLGPDRPEGGRRARERAVAGFSLEAIVAGIAKLYRALRSGSHA